MYITFVGFWFVLFFEHLTFVFIDFSIFFPLAYFLVFFTSFSAYFRLFAFLKGEIKLLTWDFSFT